MNLGMSQNFGYVDLDHLVFPTTMRVDWIRVYQPKNEINIGCDPKDFPTAAYIDRYVFCSSTKQLVEDESNNQIYRGIHKPQPDNMERRLQTTIPKEQIVETMLGCNPSIPSTAL